MDPNPDTISVKEAEGDFELGVGDKVISSSADIGELAPGQFGCAPSFYLYLWHRVDGCEVGFVSGVAC